MLVLAVIGAACSSVAFAGQLKQTKAAAPVVKATTLSDAQMDKVTAGDNGVRTLGGDNGLHLGNGIGQPGNSGSSVDVGFNTLLWNRTMLTYEVRDRRC
jgi:hypothetical protein